MQLAIVAAGFSAGEADRLRRAMAAWRRRGSLGPFEDRLISGMRERGYAPEFAQQIFNQIRGFGEYGFPESHAASFALLVYVSAWLKHHHPAVFTCALVNSQPMGFYAPSQLVQCAQRHGVEVRPADVRHSDWDCSLEAGEGGRPALRLGLRLCKGLSRQAAEALLAYRREAALESVQQLHERAGLDRAALGALAAADALRGLSGHRYLARWQVSGVEAPLPLLTAQAATEAAPMLARPGVGEQVIADYNSTGLSLRHHPLALIRGELQARRMLSAAEVRAAPDDSQVYAAGLVITRQRPASAGGVVFVTLEDETGCLNLVVWERVMARQRRVLLDARLMAVRGRVQRKDEVLHIIAGSLEDHSGLLAELRGVSRDFH